MNNSATSDNDRLPPQTKFIVGNEACERFSYYGMRSILTGYITAAVLKGGLGQSPDTATSLVHFFIFANYFMPLFGGWLSDRFIGRYYTILYVSLFYCAGHGVLACSDFFHTTESKMICLGSGLALIAFGSGGIKPCISAFVGDQFKLDQGHLLQKAYGLFYWSINFGSFFSFLAIPWIKNQYGYGPAFGVPGIFMAIATFVFWLGTKHYVRVPPSRTTKSAGFMKVFWFALTHQSLKKTGQSFWDAARTRFSDKEVDAAKSVGPILAIFALIPPFWALFDQSNSTWVMQGEKMIPYSIFGFNFGAEQMQSTNPVMVMILVPLLTLGAYPRLGRLATPLRRMGAGMFFAASSFVAVAWLQQRIDAGEQLSINWQILPYFLLTTGEVLLSVTGLEFAFAEAAPEMKSIIQSFWLLTVAFGDLLVSIVTQVLTTGSGASAHAGSITAQRFMMYAALTFAVAVIFSFSATFYQYRHSSFKNYSK